MNKISLVIILILTLVLVAVTGGFLYTINKQEKPTLNWKTYKDNVYGYQFKAPKDWKIEKGKEEQTGLVVLKDETNIQQLTISATQNKEDQEIFQGLCHNQNSKECDSADKGTIDFNTGTGFVYDDSFSPEPKNRRFIILANKRITFSLVNEDTNKEKTINSIINSIEVEQERREIDEAQSIREFLDGEYQFEDVDTLSWQIYRNEKYGFEVKVPEGWGCYDIGEDEEVVSSYAYLYEDPKLSSLITFPIKFPVACLPKNSKEHYFRKYNPQLDSDSINRSLESTEYDSIGFTIRPNFENSLKQLFVPNDMRKYNWMLFTWEGIKESKIARGKEANKDDFRNYLIKLDKQEGIIFGKGNVGAVSMSVNHNEKDFEMIYKINRNNVTSNDYKQNLDGIIQSFKFIN